MADPTPTHTPVVVAITGVTAPNVGAALQAEVDTQFGQWEDDSPKTVSESRDSLQTCQATALALVGQLGLQDDNTTYDVTITIATDPEHNSIEQAGVMVFATVGDGTDPEA